MLAKASPRKPYVPMEARSSKVFSFEVVNLSQRIGRSSFYISCQNVTSQSVYVAPQRETDVNTMAIVSNLEEL